MVNLVDRRVEVFARPSPTGYQSHTTAAPGDSPPVTLDGRVVGTVAVADLLP